jgi:cystathionine gamma-synthase
VTFEFETVALHAGQEPDPQTGAVVPPIHQSSTFKQDGVGVLRGGYEYGRSANPTRTALEQCIAALEGGARGLAFASGLAAEDTLLRAVCEPGDHVVVPNDAYGGTYRLFADILRRWGVEHTPVALSDVDAVRGALRPTTKVIWVETPTNPLLSIADITQLASVAHEAGALLAVDNTFASPYLQQPLQLGADVVVHSTTKYLGGHSDVVGGALVAGDATLGERLILSSGFVAVTVVVHRETGKPAAPAHLYSRGFSEDPKALEPVARNVERELESLAADNITDPTRIAQAVRRTVGKWVGETYRRQPMIVPTVIEI